ncbi:hexapeptide repeat-containing protein, partial [Cavenderia fasciculata]
NITKIVSSNTTSAVVAGKRSFCTYYDTKDNQLPYDTTPIKIEKDNQNHVGKYLDLYNKHKNQVPFYNKDSAFTPGVWGLYPRVSDGSFVAPSASLVGNVYLGYGASIWYGAVLKADVNIIYIGTYANIQDGTVIREATRPLSLDHDGSTVVGHYTTIGHNCILESCTVEENCLIGMGSILESGSYVEANSILGANSILPKGARVLTGELWAGRPAKFVRKLTEEEIINIHNQAAQYYDYSETHNQDLGLHNPSSVHLDAESQGVEVGYKERGKEEEKEEEMASFENVPGQLQRLNNITQQIRLKKATIGSPSDSVQFRDQLKTSIEEGNNIIQSIKTFLNKQFDRNDRTRVNKIKNDFKRLSDEFESEATQIINLELRNAIGSGGRSRDLSVGARDRGSFSSRIQYNSERDRELSRGGKNQVSDVQLAQMQIHLTDAQEVDDLILQEYNTEVKKLVEDLQIVQEITKDIHALTVEQGEMLQVANIQTENAANEVKSGVQEQEQAYGYKKSYRKKIIILIILLIILAAIIVAITVPLVKK